MLDLGKIMVTPAGEWNAETSYEYLSLVSYGNAGWVAKRDSVGVVPGTDESVWQFLGNGIGGPGGDVAGHLPVELFATSYDGLPHLFLRAPAGVIDPATDTLVFARCVSNTERPAEKTIPRERYKGWVRPGRTHDITLRYARSSRSTQTTDYYEILPSVSTQSYFYGNFHVKDYTNWAILANNVEEYIAEEKIRADRGDDHHEGSVPAKLNKRCGICVMRNGVQVTEYMPFRLLAEGRRATGHDEEQRWGGKWGFRIE